MWRRRLRILVIHNAVNKNRRIESSLKTEQAKIDSASDISAGLGLLSTHHYDAIVMDLGDVGSYGASAVQQMRAQEEFAPILAIDGCRSSEDRIRLLEAGADDCLAEPFLPEELAIRLRVMLRRTARWAGNLSVDDLELNGARHLVHRQGKPIPLTPKEFAVLQCLMRHAGQPVSRGLIMREVWKRDTEDITNLVDVYINYLREKIDRCFDKPLIRTVHGVGYIIASSTEQSAA